MRPRIHNSSPYWEAIAAACIKALVHQPGTKNSLLSVPQVKTFSFVFTARKILSSYLKTWFCVLKFVFGRPQRSEFCEFWSQHSWLLPAAGFTATQLLQMLLELTLTAQLAPLLSPWLEEHSSSDSSVPQLLVNAGSTALAALRCTLPRAAGDFPDTDMRNLQQYLLRRETAVALCFFLFFFKEDLSA